MADENYKFRPLDPPLLYGVKTEDKAPLKMRKVGPRYQKQPVQRLNDTVQPMVDTQEVMESYGLYNIGKVKKSIGNDLTFSYLMRISG